jgi:hypothetical protein
MIPANVGLCNKGRVNSDIKSILNSWIVWNCSIDGKQALEEDVDKWSSCCIGAAVTLLQHKLPPEVNISCCTFFLRKYQDATYVSTTDLFKVPSGALDWKGSVDWIHFCVLFTLIAQKHGWLVKVGMDVLSGLAPACPFNYRCIMAYG